MKTQRTGFIVLCAVSAAWALCGQAKATEFAIGKGGGVGVNDWAAIADYPNLTALNAAVVSSPMQHTINVNTNGVTGTVNVEFSIEGTGSATFVWRNGGTRLAIHNIANKGEIETNETVRFTVTGISLTADNPANPLAVLLSKISVYEVTNINSTVVRISDGTHTEDIAGTGNVSQNMVLTNNALRDISVGDSFTIKMISTVDKDFRLENVKLDIGLRVPLTPANLTATPSTSQVTLNWDDSPEGAFVSSFNVYRSTTAVASNFVLTASSLTASGYLDTDVVDLQDYWYKVTAVSTNGIESARTASVMATPFAPDAIAPATPTGLAATAIGTAQINLLWNANTEIDMAGYIIYRSTVSGSGYAAVYTNANAVAHRVDNSVLANTPYYYAVKAYDLSGNKSEFSAEATATASQEGPVVLNFYDFVAFLASNPPPSLAVSQDGEPLANPGLAVLGTSYTNGGANEFLYSVTLSNLTADATGYQDDILTFDIRVSGWNVAVDTNALTVTRLSKADVTLANASRWGVKGSSVARVDDGEQLSFQAENLSLNLGSGVTGLAGVVLFNGFEDLNMQAITLQTNPFGYMLTADAGNVYVTGNPIGNISSTYASNALPSTVLNVSAVSEPGGTVAYRPTWLDWQITLSTGSAVPGYPLWAAGFGLTGGPAGDDDGDDLSNLYEYGLGGNPTNALDLGHVPSLAAVTGGMEYIYAKRTDDATLRYYLELNPDLIYGTWTNSGYSIIGTGTIDSAFDAVTNSIPTATAQKFIRLIIETP